MLHAFCVQARVKEQRRVRWSAQKGGGDPVDGGGEDGVLVERSAKH